MSKFEESNFYKALQDFFINNNKDTFLQFLAEFYNRTEGIIDKNKIQDDLIKELRELYLEFNEKGIDENIVREKVNYFLENSLKINDIISKLNRNSNNIQNISSQMDTKANKNDLQFINVKWFGTKGDGVTDDTQSLQDAIDYAYNNGIEEVYIPLGEYKITKTLNLHFNLKLKGAGSNKTYIIVSENIVGYALIYGNTYSYGNSKGEISSLCFKSGSDVCVSKGVFLNSGIKFYDFYCYKLKSCIHTIKGQYIDNLKIINSSFAYCCGGSDYYVIDLNGNMDALEIEGVHIVDAYTELNEGESSFSQYRGLRIYGSTGGYIKNSIINNCIIIENVHGFSIENLHNEGSQHSSYKGNKSYIKIINSNVEISNSYLHKRIDGENITITNNKNSDTHDACNVILNNVIIDITSNTYKYIGNYMLTDEILKSNFTTLKLNNCFVRHNFSASWTTTNELRGVRIRDIEVFNTHSSYLSYNCLISNDNNILTDNPIISQNSNIANSNMVTYSNSSVNVPWFINDTNKTYYINCVLCFDYTRKLALIKNVTEQVISNVNRDKGILIRFNKSVFTDGKGLEFIYYRGETSEVYNKICRIPLSMSYYVFDTGTHVMGIKVNDRTPDNIDNFNYVEKVRTINNGENVEFYSSTLPTYGVFKKYDKCINTNIRSGQIKEWVYNGNEWVSLGIY